MVTPEAPNMKGGMTARDEPANASLIEHCLAAMALEGQALWLRWLAGCPQRF